MSQLKPKTLIDSVFATIIKNKPCLYIWRVEETQLMLVAKDFYGIFFKSDTYLIYSCSESNTNRSLSQHIHLWIGSESSNDDQGIGAFKMIELDEFLNNAPIQHRECQNHETERFLNYFKNQGGIKYLNGGWQTGDHYYEKESRNRLFRVKGKRLVRLNELKPLDWSSLNRSDSFLIDFNSVIFIWNGRNTNKLDKIQLLNKVKFLRSDRNVNIVIIEDGEEKDMSKEELKLFEFYFPLKDKLKKLKNELASDIMDDFRIERDVTNCLKLYKCSYGQDEDEDTIKIKIIEQKPAPLYRDDLTSEDSFIIDNGRLGIYVWSGRKCYPKERQEAMRNALGFLQAKGYEEHVQNAIKVTCINEAYEPVEFRALFSRWSESKYTINNSNNKSLQVKFDSNVLNANPQLASELQMVDDGSGEKKIWVIKNIDVCLLDENKHGQFYSQCCYVVEYKYCVNGNDSYIIFYWIGRKSSIDTQNIAFIKAIEFEKKLATNYSHLVRVYEEKETKQFMSMFNGKIIIFQDFTNELLDFSKLENFMLQVKYYGHLNIKANQVDFKPTSLNSNNVFIICSNQNYYVWCGKASTGDERETAKSILFSLKKEPQIIIETQEKENFWSILGGKQVYPNDKRTTTCSQSVQIVRLFEILNENGKILSQEIFDFSQEDLNINEIMFLDIYEAIFIWIGSGANKKDIDELDKIIKEYLKNDPCQRQIDTPILRIRQGFEPIYFTGFFKSGWNENLFELGLTYKELKLELHSQNDPELFLVAIQQSTLKTNEIKKNPVNDFNNYPKYSYDELIKPADELPENVNTTIKELYLRESDFIKIFNMTFDEFSQKPAWKQKELKRSAHLF